jgi:CDP-diacylglycerol---serine O-phosphatidyltransferase
MQQREDGRLRFLRRAGDKRPKHRLRRGVSLLPSLFTMGNMFCGYACIVYSMHRDFEIASVFIGIAIVVDMLDGRIARLTGTESEFGAELDSLADVISFGVAPAILAFGWGLSPLGRLGWAAGFFYVTAAALRLARFNLKGAGAGDKRYFAGMPSPPAAGVAAATVFAYPAGLQDPRAALPALAVVLLPAVLMVSRVRFRSFKTIDLRVRRSYSVLVFVAAGIMLIATHPRGVLVTMAYTYLASPFVGMAYARMRHGRAARAQPAVAAAPHDDEGGKVLQYDSKDQNKAAASSDHAGSSDQ